MKNLYVALSMAAVVLGMSSCQSASKHYDSLSSTKEREMTVGTVQREIRNGMSGADVATVLGSPNIVTTDANGGEVWIYDKISTDVSYSQSSGGVGGGLGAGGGGRTMIIGGLFGGYNSSAGASSQTQRTLTVVIKFNAEHLVRDFSYHSSKF